MPGKEGLRLVPFRYLCNALDKGNVGNAKTDNWDKVGQLGSPSLLHRPYIVDCGRISISLEIRYCDNPIKSAEYSPRSLIVLYFGHDILCKFPPSASVLKLIRNGCGGSLLSVSPRVYAPPFIRC